MKYIYLIALTAMVTAKLINYKIYSWLIALSLIWFPFCFTLLLIGILIIWYYASGAYKIQDRNIQTNNFLQPSMERFRAWRSG